MAIRVAPGLFLLPGGCCAAAAGERAGQRTGPEVLSLSPPTGTNMERRLARSGQPSHEHVRILGADTVLVMRSARLRPGGRLLVLSRYRSCRLLRRKYLPIPTHHRPRPF